MEKNEESVLGQWTSEYFTFTLRSNKFSMVLIEGTEYKGTYSNSDGFLSITYINNNIFENLLLRIESISQYKLTIKCFSRPYYNKIIDFKRTYFDIDLIKDFDCYELHGKNISEIKTHLELETLHLNLIKNKQGNKTNILRHWEYDARFAVILDKDLAEKIKINKDTELSLYSEYKLANLGYYTNFRIEEYEEPIDNRRDYEDSTRSYETYNGAYGYDDDTIESAFDGDPENYWNID